MKYAPKCQRPHRCNEYSVDGADPQRRVTIFVLITVWMIGGSMPSRAGADSPWSIESVGVYGGVSLERDRDYRQVEGVVNLNTPLVWESHGGTRLAALVQAGSGVVRAAGETAFFGGAGGRLKLSRADLPVWLEIGLRAGVITEDRFGDDDLGGPFQFTSHLAVGGDLGRVRIGVRFQHTSNAGIYTENNGYNILSGMLEFGF